MNARPARKPITLFWALNLAPYAVLGYLAFQLAIYLYGGVKLAYAHVVEPDPGTPPFRVLYPHYDTPAHKVARMDFPDA